MVHISDVKPQLKTVSKTDLACPHGPSILGVGERQTLSMELITAVIRYAA